MAPKPALPVRKTRVIRNMKRSVEITAEEYEKLVAPHKRRAETYETITRINKRNEVFSEQCDEQKGASIFTELNNHIVDEDFNNLLLKENEEFFTPSVIPPGVPKCDLPYYSTITNEIGRDYIETLLQGVPSSQQLSKKIQEMGIRIRALNTEKAAILEGIKKDIGPLIWKETDSFIEGKKKEYEELKKRVGTFGDFLEEIGNSDYDFFP